MVKKFGTNLGQGLESHQINRLIRKISVFKHTFTSNDPYFSLCAALG